MPLWLNKGGCLPCPARSGFAAGAPSAASVGTCANDRLRAAYCIVKRRPQAGEAAGMAAKAAKPGRSGRLIGYARVSTEDQDTDPQGDELRAAGCAVVLEGAVRLAAGSGYGSHFRTTTSSRVQYGDGRYVFDCLISNDIHRCGVPRLRGGGPWTAQVVWRVLSVSPPARGWGHCPADGCGVQEAATVSVGLPTPVLTGWSRGVEVYRRRECSGTG
jgi:hypothetical protein